MVFQSEYAITSEEDQNPKLTTFGIGSCHGILLFDHKNGIGAIAHSDANYYVFEEIVDIVKELEKLGGESYVVGLVNVSKHHEEWIIDYLLKRKKFEKLIYLPREFTLDTTTGEIKDHIPKGIGKGINRKRMERLEKRVENHIFQLFKVYSPI